MTLKVSHESLVTVTAKALSRAIADGRFAGRLPPERPLSLQLGVSRPILRAALRSLEHRGVISAADGRKGRTVLTKAAAQRQRPGVAAVCFLQSSLPHDQFNENLRTQEFLAENLAAIDSPFHIAALPETSAKKHLSALEKTVAAYPDAAWILHLAPHSVQQWFQQRALPAIILGSPQPGITLPSIDEDYAATCRHAAGMFLSRGHTRLAVLERPLHLVGDQISSTAFEEGASLSDRPDVTVVHQTHDSTIRGICRAVDRLRSQNPRPTGWLIFSARTYFTAASHLLREGVRLGSDISLICRDADPYFEALVPSVAHYRRDVERKNRLLLNFLKGVVAHQRADASRWLLASTFQDGDSLSPARSQPTHA